LPVSDDPAVDYEARYRRAVLDRLDYVHLFGIDVPRETTEYSLSVAYVSLNLADELAEEDEEEESRAVREPIGEDDEDRRGEVSSRFVETSLPAEEFFNKLGGDQRRLLIRGAAGCGKTTLLRWAAVQAGRGADPTQPPRRMDFQSVQEESGRIENPSREIPPEWRSLVPFIIRLRDYPDGELPRPQDYPLKLAKELPDAPPGRMDRLLKNGRALLMFDGVDEVPRARRGQVLAEIRQLLKTYPGNAFVVTTRPEAVERAEFQELGFLSARVEPLSPQDRTTFIDRWHEAMEVRLRKRNEPQDLRPVAQRLQERLDETPAIARLTISPLLCAAVCALHLRRAENLPETPVDLCEKLSEMLLERRDKERPGMGRERTEDEQYLQLDYAKRKGILSRLAHHMVLAGTSAVNETDADRQIAEGLKSYNLADLRAERIRHALIERSGLLQESSDQRIEFLHNTLKEYLASERFANRGEFQIMADHCHEESWQPVILFAVALPREGSDFATKLVRAVLVRTPLNDPPKGRKKADKQQAAALRSSQFFFFRCCTTAYQIDDEQVRTAFEKVSKQLLPPRSLTDAEALAACGDSVVPYLAANEKWSAQQRAACVRALGIIAGPRAIRHLRDYGRNVTTPVASEFARIFKNAPEFFVAISSALTGVTSLNLYGSKARDVAALAALTSLRELYLYFSRVSDVSALASLTSLESLLLHNTPVSDVSALASLTSLQSLDLGGTQVSDVSALASLTSLRLLDLSGTQVSDPSALSSLTKQKRQIIGAK